MTNFIYGKCDRHQVLGVFVNDEGYFFHNDQRLAGKRCDSSFLIIHDDGELADRCAVCGSRIEYLDSPGGGWWAHEFHPSDSHEIAHVRVTREYLREYREYLVDKIFYPPLVIEEELTPHDL